MLRKQLPRSGRTREGPPRFQQDRSHVRPGRDADRQIGEEYREHPGRGRGPCPPYSYDILAALSTSAGHKLQVAGITYSYDIFQSPVVDASSVMLGGKPLDVSAIYRVTTNNFVAGGGDGFSSFKNGTNATNQGIDVDALAAYLGAVSSASSPLAPPTPGRVNGNGCQ